IIIGGGFAGLTASRKLAAHKDIFEVTLLDKKNGFDFLPSLPDSIGRGITPGSLTYNIESISRRKGFEFINEEVSGLDLDKRKVFTEKRNLEYDYLIIASGSETNFYGNENIQKEAFRLDSAEDADRIRKVIREKLFSNYVVSGGGYTGIEVATNLRLFLNKNKNKGKIVIVERASAILGPLPGWIKQYVLSNLIKMDIELLLNASIERIENNIVYLQGGKTLNDSLVIWAAGVKTAGFIQNLKAEKNPQGRIQVNEYLKLNDRCFVAGDAAYFKYKDAYLRMAVQFAIIEGESAANNVINSVLGKKLKSYKPLDLGYIIPMANNRSCGVVFGLKIKGVVATIFHFMMCIYRLCGFRNKIWFMKGLLTRV
ncbi:MAG: FAD-dependent oxidoreductase, partial [Candidatus Omnitrophota bacterium]